MRHSRQGPSLGGVGCALLIVSMVVASGCEKPKEAEQKPEPTLVQTAVAVEGSITEWVDLQGRIAPPYDRDATLSPQVPGRIVFLAARVGEMVAAGAVVARVETASLDDELRAAEAALKRAEADLVFKRGVAKRSRDLVAKGVASREEAESADAAAVAAESTQAEGAATLATARRRRGWSELTAPFAGVVVRVDRRIGDFVDGTAATPVVEIAATDGWEVVASAASASLQRLRAGQSATIVGVGEDAAGLGATVTSIARAVDPQSGAGDVRLRPSSRPQGVALGAPVQVRVALRVRRKAVLVPNAAVRMSEDGSAEVVVVEDGVAHVKKIETGLSESGHVEVVSGLTLGAHVVIEDPIGIADGASLKEATESESREAKPGEPESKKSPGDVK